MMEDESRNGDFIMCIKPDCSQGRRHYAVVVRGGLNWHWLDAKGLRPTFSSYKNVAWTHLRKATKEEIVMMILETL